MNIELDDYSQTEAFEETELQESSKAYRRAHV